MFSFLRTNDSRESSTASEARTGRRTHRRAPLHVEGLEGRQLLNARFAHSLIAGGANGGYTGPNSGYFSHFGTGPNWQARMIRQGGWVTVSNQGGSQDTKPTSGPGMQTSSNYFSNFGSGPFWQARNFHGGSVTFVNQNGSGNSYTYGPGGFRL